MPPQTYFVVTAPGLERLAAQELAGVKIVPLETESGGVTFKGNLEHLYRANLHLRTASRVVLRFGNFYAAAFSELRKKAARLEWERFLQPGQPVTLHVSCHKSRLYHSEGVAERIVSAIGDRLGQPSPRHTSDEDQEGTTPQLILVRLVRDLCTISIDTSGELLHRRGYRKATAKAPLRETLAAAMLLSSGWDGQSPLIDPFCGSGTIPIEAALLAAHIPPGRNRHFTWMDWPDADLNLWERVKQAAQPLPLASLPPILASDRDAGAVEMAQANAERAGVGAAVSFSCRAVSAIEPPSGPGWVVTNPPYGLRVSANKDVRNLYAQFGNVLRQQCPGWQVAILCSDANLLGQTRLPLDTSLSWVNGGVPVLLGRGQIPPA